ncbi:aminoacyl-tRNA hydrolase [Candidatus Endomicrobiellum trichonymphae]|uniref:Peptidyl-tRNA hydrolase n=1 Tax=Endomicrobium trichonymphae TaxID=1408204 RepID=B1GYU8_ENDTX|nr:aminoacyl-tRNA hydrolase [Candidatus Endomicrobium trichonymphae]BAG14191.1 peptidyl-tRNA hydrolase [Candidatus Endomicrobium trichonymphae]
MSGQIEIKLFIGLGNPGQKYENTRHNLGFIILDEIVDLKHLKFKMWNDMAEVSFYGEPDFRVWFLKPVTFMNLSGIAVSSFAKCYKIKPEEIFVFYDDFLIPFGEYRVKMSGSSGGHNGMSSIIESLHSDNLPRMKLGIGPLPKFIPAADFVLSKFAREDKDRISLIKKTAVSLFDEVYVSGLDKTVSKLANIK